MNWSSHVVGDRDATAVAGAAGVRGRRAGVGRRARHGQPALFIHYRNVSHCGPVQADCLTGPLGLSAQALCDDRILHEVLAAGGGTSRLCDLFGLSIGGAERYTAVLDHPDINRLDASCPTSRTNPTEPA